MADLNDMAGVRRVVRFEVFPAAYSQFLRRRSKSGPISVQSPGIVALFEVCSIYPPLLPWSFPLSYPHAALVCWGDLLCPSINNSLLSWFFKVLLQILPFLSFKAKKYLIILQKHLSPLNLPKSDNFLIFFSYFPSLSIPVEPPILRCIFFGKGSLVDLS